MVAACVLAVVLSFRYDHPAIAALGLIGGFLTPPLLHTRNDNPWLLFPYLLLLDGFSIAIAVRRHWPILHVIAFSGTAIVFIAWASSAGAAKIGIGLFFLSVFFALFFAAAIQLFRRTEQTMPLVLLPFNAFWTLVSASTLSHGNDSSWIALFALALAIVYVAGAYTMRAEPATVHYALCHWPRMSVGRRHTGDRHLGNTPCRTSRQGKFYQRKCVGFSRALRRGDDRVWRYTEAANRSQLLGWLLLES